MKELIGQMLIYVVIVSALRGLLLNKKYEDYFRFFSGLIMILILLSPILSFLGKPSKWYDKLETNLLRMDVREIKGTLKVTDDQLEKMVQKKYQVALEQEIKALAKEQGVSLAEAEVVLEKGKNGIEIREVSGRLDQKDGKTRQMEGADGAGEEQENSVQEGTKEDVKKIAIETVQTEKRNKGIKKSENVSKEAQSLKSGISKKLELSQDKVHIWK